MKVMLNGHICDADQAHVSILDHGLLYGIGLFETLRTYGGQCFLLEEHLQRLRLGCAELGIVWEWDIQDVERQVQQLLAVNEFKDAYVRMTVSAGNDAVGLPSGDYDYPNTIIYMKELPFGGIWQVPESLEKSLQRLRIRRNTPEGRVRFKSLHFMNNILAKRELHSYPWAQQAEGLFLTEQLWLAEGIVSNLFFVRNGTLYTPSLQTGILAGITREHVMHLGKNCGISVEEGLYTWEDLLQADEIFITNSVQEISPIVQLFDEEGRSSTVGRAVTGQQTRQLIQAYRASVEGKELI